MVTGMEPAPRILIVDDEPNARDALSELLSDEGYEVSTAIDGLAARARIAEFHPDLVLSDMHMPGLDGLALLASMRDVSGRPAMVLMSAYPQPAAVETPFIAKPIDIDHLLAIVQETLAERRRLQW